MQAHKWHRGKYNNGTDDSTLRNYRDCYSKDGTNCFQGANGGAPVRIDALELTQTFDPTATGFADLAGASPVMTVKARITLERVR